MSPAHMYCTQQSGGLTRGMTLRPIHATGIQMLGNQMYIPPTSQLDDIACNTLPYAFVEMGLPPQSLQAREADLPQIQEQLNSATTIQQVDSIQARLSAEQNYATAQTAQAANLQVLATEQAQADQEAQNEEYRQSVDQALASSCQVLAQDGQPTTGCTP